MLELEPAAGRHVAHGTSRRRAAPVGRALPAGADGGESPLCSRCLARWASSRAPTATASRSTPSRSSAATRTSGCSPTGDWHEGLYLSAGAERRRPRAAATASSREVDRWVAWRDGKGRQAFTLPTAAGSDDAEVTALDRLSMAEWLDQRRLHVAAAALAGRLRLPRRLRRDARRTSAPGRACSTSPRAAAPRRRAAAAADLARGQRPARRATWRRRRSGSCGSASPSRTSTDRPSRRGVEVTAISAARVASSASAPSRSSSRRRSSSRGTCCGRTARAPPAHVARVRVRLVDGGEPAPRRPAGGAGLPAGVGQRALRQPVAGLRRRHAPGRASTYGPTIFTYYYPLTASDTPRRAAAAARTRPRRVGRAGAGRPGARAPGPAPAGDAARRHALGPRDDPAAAGLRLGRGPARRRRPYRGVHFAAQRPERAGAVRGGVRPRRAGGGGGAARRGASDRRSSRL